MAARYQISVIFTDACNMRCTYCSTAKRPNHLDSERLAKVAALLARTSPAPLDLNFHGGEPLLNWDRVVELVDHIRPQMGERRISLNLCTNATHLTEDRARFLADHGFNVRVSIDGRKASHVRARLAHDRDTRPEQLYAATLAGLRHLVRFDARVAANMVVTPDTVGDLLSNAVFLIKQGLVHLVISPVVGVPWPDEAVLELDRQLRQMGLVWRRWLEKAPPHLHEDLRRNILSEIDRATYCIGERMNQPDALVLVFGPDGRIFGDEPDIRTEKALVLGHVDEVEDIDALPGLPRTAFQLMYDREHYPPHVLKDLRRTHRLLRKRMVDLYVDLFGHPPSAERRFHAG
jgi:sulfatase maturation enzyme AslB (radical SAM superfamily)